MLYTTLESITANDIISLLTKKTPQITTQDGNATVRYSKKTTSFIIKVNTYIQAEGMNILDVKTFYLKLNENGQIEEIPYSFDELADTITSAVKQLGYFDGSGRKRYYV